VFNVLLQVLDDGRLTDNKGVTVDFTNTVIIMTSNIGSHLIQQKIDASGGEFDWDDYIELQKMLMDNLRQVIRPEFLNRVDDTIVFHPLGREHIRKIVDIQLAKVHKLLGHNKIKLHVSDSVKDWLAARGYHVSYGARPLKRLIQTEITNKLATILLSRTTDGPAQYDVQVSKDGEALNFIEVFDNAEAWSGG
jgi:ATP-dependent Clp protease ATP-binding subunit ClpB